MKKNYYSFLLLFLVVLTSIAYLGNQNRSQLTQFANDLLLNNPQSIINTKTISNLHIEKDSTQFKYNFLKKYPSIRNCNLNSRLYNTVEQESSNTTKYDYSQPAPSKLHQLRIVKGVLVYFPIEIHQSYIYEFKWLYRSWIEMQRHEPSTWRTDLIVFIKNDKYFFDDQSFFLNELNCSFLHRRKSNLDKPMCTLIEYNPIKSRTIVQTELTISLKENKEKYDHVLKNIDIFSDNHENLSPFYSLIKEKLSDYGYVDSILMAFDGYNYLKSAGYNFLIRSDMDVFLTPLFAKWLPRNCNDFYVGRGGYSSSFNVNRLRRIAKDLGFGFASEMNLGSTWYSTPDQFRLVSYLTLFGMAYVSEEEFTKPEREGKVGVLLWPYWHYGVLLLYGQNMVMNHLIQTKQLDIIKLQDYLDYPSYYSENVHKIIHIHVFHGDEMFSKFQFKAGKYDNMSLDVGNPEITKFYSLKMALEGKKISSQDLHKLFQIEAEKKS